MVFCYAISVIALAGGVLFFTGKGASYIKGYANMPDEEKKKIKIKPLCKNVSVAFFTIAVIFAAAGYSEAFRLNYLKWAMIGWMVLCCADALYISKSGRYIQ